MNQDLVIIGGGIMGLMTAYYASLMRKKVTILEKLTIGNKKASSFSFTRSIRSDYLDPYYARLAQEARILWEELQNYSEEKFVIDCGCLNLVKKNITPNIETTYGAKAFGILSELGIESLKLNKKQLKKKFPQFNVDGGYLDVQAGFLYLPQITSLILKQLKERKVKIVEDCKVSSVQDIKGNITVKTDKGVFKSKSLVITAGIWVNDIMKLIKDNDVKFPITPDRPQQCRYFVPKNLSDFTPDTFPVFAYLDVGIYGHPFYKGKTKGIKIGFYNPPDFKKDSKSKINSIDDFIKECMPELLNVTSFEVKDADQCYYDLVSDDDFILGQLGTHNIFIGTGWRGTGYKFAPLIGKILAQLSVQKGTVYDIKRFSPMRFSENL